MFEFIKSANFFGDRSTQEITKLKSRLNTSEIDDLKYRLSLSSLEDLEKGFDISKNPAKREHLDRVLRNIAALKPFLKKIKPFGINYIGRPDFMTDVLLKNLSNEAESFKASARPNFNQMMYQPDTHNNQTFAEKFAESKELRNLVEKYAINCSSSFITSYIYYTQKGHSSPPHVDNYFTSITAMVALKHTCAKSQFQSSSVAYWPERDRFDYKLKPGEISIFFGVSALHGRTPIDEGEEVQSLLTSFLPI